MRLVYVTSQFPLTDDEAFLAAEARALAGSIDRLCIVPMRPVRPALHEDAAALVDLTVASPLLSPRIARTAASELARSPRACLRPVSALARGRSPRILAKNILVTPKALWLARLLREVSAEHVHVHWGGTSATMGMLAAERAGIPWSLTLHRWDITENNLLARKIRSASFVRTISAHGAAEVRRIVPGSAVEVIHMGVELAALDGVATAPRREPGSALRLLAVGQLIPVKGHCVLLDALAAVVADPAQPEVTLDVAGDGPLRATLEARARRLGLERRVRFLGWVPHASLLQRLQARSWDALVHPSIDVDGQHEGIPVALMEAMAAGIPVVATRTGGVSELVDGASGLSVGQSPDELAGAIRRLAGDPGLAEELGLRGRERVLAEFEVGRVAATLLQRILAASAG